MESRLLRAPRAPAPGRAAALLLLAGCLLISHAEGVSAPAAESADALASPGAPKRRPGLLQRAIRAESSGSPVFSAAAAPRAGEAQPKVQYAGFCARPDQKPVCAEPPCCCWSTYGGVARPELASPVSYEAVANQRCLNPPKGYAYVPEPGLTHDDGQLRQLALSGEPTYQGRRLCCLTDPQDPNRHSMREPGFHINEPAA
mmetsp:Transcript_51808/g.152684  ORF Transcript_51808/g.152684 Transcript_51808/m.152684 type:complete len:201 (+) Transcript_51808:48-650(+)